MEETTTGLLSSKGNDNLSPLQPATAIAQASPRKNLLII
jgi:hypothetical protein